MGVQWSEVFVSPLCTSGYAALNAEVISIAGPGLSAATQVSPAVNPDGVDYSAVFRPAHCSRGPTACPLPVGPMSPGSTPRSPPVQPSNHLTVPRRHGPPASAFQCLRHHRELAGGRPGQMVTLRLLGSYSDAAWAWSARVPVEDGHATLQGITMGPPTAAYFSCSFGSRPTWNLTW